jgi:hypothetical protein
MEKITLKLGEILQLESEINGFNNPETGEQIYKGFLKQNLSIILKYELTELGETLSKERKKVETLRDELIVKYGEESESGGVMVRMYDEEKDDDGNVLTAVLNPKYLEFDKEYGTLLSQEKEIEYPEITKDDLRDAGKTNDQYKVLFKLIKKEGAI